MTTAVAPPRVGATDGDAPPPRSPNRLATGHLLGPSVASGSAVALAALALSPLFDSGDWFGTTLLVIAVVTAIGGAATWARLPLFLVPVLQAVGLFAVLVARFTTDAPLGFVPTATSLSSLREVLSTGMGDIDRYAPPVPVAPGVTAVAGIGIGCVAIVVFVLQVNLRMPVVAGLALISVYVVPSFVLDEGAPWWGFATVSAGWMLLLISDERVGLASWGRVLRRGGATTTSAVSGLSSAALRLGVIAVVTAVALPVLVPSLADAVLGRRPTGFGTGDGTGTDPTQVGLNPFVSLRRDLLQQPDVVVLRYQTDAARPSYLRTVVLEQYVGEQWLPRAFDPANATRLAGDVTLTTDVAPGVATTAQNYQFTADKLVNPFAPVPENATSVRGLAGQWYDDSATGTIFGVDSTTKDASWSVRALVAAPTSAQFQASSFGSTPDVEQLRAASAAVPEVVTVDAREWTAAGTTNYEKAILLQNYFRQNFRYSTAAAADQSASAIESFLNDRSGYCQQFAATMALMARSLGIPSRVVVGYTPGTKQGDTWVVTGKDAHAWPELFFPGIGWVRFEPTPRAASDGGSVQVPTYAQVLPPSTTDPGSTAVRRHLSRQRKGRRPPAAGRRLRRTVRGHPDPGAGRPGRVAGARTARPARRRPAAGGGSGRAALGPATPEAVRLGLGRGRVGGAARHGARPGARLVGRAHPTSGGGHRHHRPAPHRPGRRGGDPRRSGDRAVAVRARPAHVGGSRRGRQRRADRTAGAGRPPDADSRAPAAGVAAPFRRLTPPGRAGRPGHDDGRGPRSTAARAGAGCQSPPSRRLRKRSSTRSMKPDFLAFAGLACGAGAEGASACGRIVVTTRNVPSSMARKPRTPTTMSEVAAPVTSSANPASALRTPTAALRRLPRRGPVDLRLETNFGSSA